MGRFSGVKFTRDGRAGGAYFGRFDPLLGSFWRPFWGPFLGPFLAVFWGLSYGIRGMFVGAPAAGIGSVFGPVWRSGVETSVSVSKMTFCWPLSEKLVIRAF